MLDGLSRQRGQSLETAVLRPTIGRAGGFLRQLAPPAYKPSMVQSYHLRIKKSKFLEEEPVNDKEE